MTRHSPYPKRQRPERWREAAEQCARQYGYTLAQLIAPGGGGMAAVKARQQVYFDLAQMGANRNAIARLMRRTCNGVCYGVRRVALSGGTMVPVDRAAQEAESAASPTPP